MTAIVVAGLFVVMGFGFLVVVSKITRLPSSGLGDVAGGLAHSGCNYNQKIFTYIKHTNNKLDVEHMRGQVQKVLQNILLFG